MPLVFLSRNIEPEDLKAKYKKQTKPVQETVGLQSSISAS
jgi:hypothetical protein